MSKKKYFFIYINIMEKLNPEYANYNDSKCGCFYDFIKCCFKSTFEASIDTVLKAINLTAEQKRIIRKRYVRQVVYYEEISNKITKRYNTCRIIISIGAMILPTLQTVQVEEYETIIFWSSVGVSLLVMIANNLIAMFSLDKNYILYNITCEKLKSTGWHFLEQSGQFTGKTYTENWVPFWNEIERIKQLQITAEFSDSSDSNNNNNKNIEINLEEKRIKETEAKNKMIHDLQNKITVLSTPSKMSYSPIQQNISFDENIKNNDHIITVHEDIDIDIDNKINKDNNKPIDNPDNKPVDNPDNKDDNTDNDKNNKKNNDITTI